MTLRPITLLAAPLFALLCASAMASDGGMEPAVADIAHRWAAITYHTQASGQEAAFKALAETADQLASSAPNDPQPKVWQAIVLSSYAKANGGLGALSAVRKARDLLLDAEALEPTTLGGSIYTSLGSLYAKVPGWPIGFGDKDKARHYLDTALTINPEGIDAHYFYASLLADQGNFSDAAAHLKQALAAPPRPGREDADAGRRDEAQALLDSIRQDHGDTLAAR
ncbi:MAG: hypothetical protein KDG55_00195 [Rhodocyclaceae bacterium]|nr:hypothetical protein [Rhodocyclaceae bacterium]